MPWVEALRARLAQRGAPGSPLAVVCGADPVLLDLDPAPSRDAWIALAGGDVLLRLEPDGALTTAPEATASDLRTRAALTEVQSVLRRARDPLARPRRLVV